MVDYVHLLGRLRDNFFQTQLLTKHHYVEHYPRRIQCFGPLTLVGSDYEVWGKTSFFKNVARHTNCF